MNAVAFGQVEGLPVVVSSGSDNTVRVSEIRRKTRWAWLRPRFRLQVIGHHHNPASRLTFVYAVAFGQVDGQPVVISGGFDGTVRLWDAYGRKPPTTINVGSSIYSLVLCPPYGLAVGFAGGLVVIDIQSPVRRPSPDVSDDA